jgi:hypothetical protein
VVGWLVISLAAVVGTLVTGYRLQRRAVACAERSDFRGVGNRLDWDVTRFSDLPGPVGAFVREVLAEPSDAGRVDLVCERLAEVDAETRQIPHRLAMLARTVLVMGGLCGISLVAQAVREHSGSTVILGLAPVLISAVAAFCCRWMGRMVSSEIECRRQSWDSLSRLLLRPHMPGLHVEGVSPGTAPDDDRHASVRPTRAIGGGKTRHRQRKVSDRAVFGVR